MTTLANGWRDRKLRLVMTVVLFGISERDDTPKNVLGIRGGLTGDENGGTMVIALEPEPDAVVRESHVCR